MKKQLYILTLLILLLPVIANAARQYTIELIAFQRFSGGESEYWPMDPGTPDISKAAHFLGTIPEPTQNNFGDNINISTSAEQMIPLVSKQNLNMGPTAYSLKRKGFLVPLHIAWSQPVKSWKSNDWNWVETDDVVGLIRVTRGKFLHLDVDLLLTDRQTGQKIRIRESRKMRSNEVHHIDHPKLGLIVRADRVVTAEE